MYQEYNLIEDILFCMMGIEGTYIKKVQGPKAKNFEYAIEPNLESSGCGILSLPPNKSLIKCE